MRFLFESLLRRNHDNKGGAILADDMGLGKTLQTLAIIQVMLTQGLSRPGPPLAQNAVVICPTTLCLNWNAEADKVRGSVNVKSPRGPSARRWTLRVALISCSCFL